MHSNNINFQKFKDTLRYGERNKQIKSKGNAPNNITDNKRDHMLDY